MVWRALNWRNWFLNSFLIVKQRWLWCLTRVTLLSGEIIAHSICRNGLQGSFFLSANGLFLRNEDTLLLHSLPLAFHILRHFNRIAVFCVDWCVKLMRKYWRVTVIGFFLLEGIDGWFKKKERKSHRVMDCWWRMPSLLCSYCAKWHWSITFEKLWGINYVVDWFLLNPKPHIETFCWKEMVRKLNWDSWM